MAMDWRNQPTARHFDPVVVVYKDSLVSLPPADIVTGTRRVTLLK